MPECVTKFWTEDFTRLFCSSKLVPVETDTLEEQMNSLTRLVLLFFMLLFVINWKYDLIFLFLCLIFIIILYYIKKGMTQNKENYKNMISRGVKNHYKNFFFKPVGCLSSLNVQNIYNAIIKEVSLCEES